MAERVADVLRRLLESAEPVGVEWVTATEAVGRVVAEEVRSRRAAPGFARAAMDGYVCHDADVCGASADRPAYLLVTGECRPGKPPAAGPDRGEAWVISTGAAMPLRGDRVLPVEVVRREGAVLVVAQNPPHKTHVVAPDEDLPEGTCVLEPGQVAGPGGVAALVAGGVREVRVYRRPRVVVFCTGDELSEPPDAPPAGKVFNTNAFALLAEVSALGCRVDYGGTLPDRPEALRAAFLRALSGPYDVVLTTGAVSVGRYDRVPRVWLDLGAEKVAGRVDLKPGGPFFAARLKDRWAVALSGSPSACLAAYHLLVRPLLLRLAGRRQVVRPVVTAALRGCLPPSGRVRAVWARILPEQDGLAVQPLLGPVFQSLAAAQALILLGAGAPILREGSVVPALLLHHPETCEELRWPAPVPAALVVGVVGASGAGKTSVVEGLVSRLRASGLRVAVVKHAPHGFDLDRSGSDSDRAARAGAVTVALVGEGEVAVRSFPGRGLTVEGATELCTRATAACGEGVDVVLVEGFQHPASRTIVVGPGKEGCVQQPWCELPSWPEIPGACQQALLDELATRLARLAREGD
ncbi:MAG: molybdopterin-guanine dinucleotide biosynthesis protein MobB [Armatimonadota bacterium]|nr:molybdopterin-guanine dinucleotide biosynthesis protein MobB [Armatimonadota bacterium]MDW8156591.1 molybdopterin-guanine dinucleotide biosynthesis protein MobB [Armatimonadota bacterium]